MSERAHFDADGRTTFGTKNMGSRVERVGDAWRWQAWRLDQSAEGVVATRRAALDACEEFWAAFVEAVSPVREGGEHGGR